MEEKDIQILKEMFRESEARMENKMEARMVEMFQESEARMEAMMDRKIDALRTENNEKFESIDQKFDAIDKRFEAIDQKFDAIDKRFEAMDKKIEDTAAQVQRNTAILMDAEFSRRFDLIEEQLQLLMEKMTAPARVDKLEDDMTVVKASIRNLSGRVQTLEEARHLQ
ncbi:MAG: hypothetical protein PUI07_01120 [Clostridiales bacterium]|nr:hypothetical protein [Clostridiales bacterium]